jgi:hypothetical protein
MELTFECTVGKLEDDPLGERSFVAVYASFADNKGPHVRFTMPRPCPLRIGDTLLINVASKP